MNIYRTTFFSRCPVDGQRIAYSLTIEAAGRIMTEDIAAACASWPSALHEDIADGLAALGGRQTLTATHGSVEIETVREREPHHG